MQSAVAGGVPVGRRVSPGRAWSLALGAALLLAVVTRTHSGVDAAPDSGPRALLSSAAARLAEGDWTALAQVRGPRELNLTVSRRGGTVRGDVQVMTARETRQLGYARFRATAGAVSGPFELLDGRLPTGGERRAVEAVLDPARLLAQVGSGGVAATAVPAAGESTLVQVTVPGRTWTSTVRFRVGDAGGP